jgi:hypothetical protein
MICLNAVNTMCAGLLAWRLHGHGTWLVYAGCSLLSAALTAYMIMEE